MKERKKKDKDALLTIVDNEIVSGANTLHFNQFKIKGIEGNVMTVTDDFLIDRAFYSCMEHYLVVLNSSEEVKYYAVHKDFLNAIAEIK